MKKLYIASIILSLMLTGCALRQSSSQIKYGNAVLTLPKDARIGYMKLSADGTNVTIVVTNSQFTMNPAVIDAATARDTALIKATADAIGAAMAEAAKAAAK